MAKKIKHGSGRKEWIIIAIIVAIAIALAFVFYSMPKSTIDYLATVNGAKIYPQDLSEIALTIPQSARGNITDADLLEQAINFEIINQEAEKLGITVSDEEVEQSIEESVKGFGMTVADLNASLKQQNIKWNTLFNAYRKQILSYRFLNSTILRNISVSEQEMKALYSQYTSQLNTSYDSIRQDLNNTVFAIKGQQALGILLKQRRAEYEILRYVGSSQ